MRLGKYELLSQASMCGMVGTWRARVESAGGGTTPVAIQKQDLSSADDRELIALLAQEAALYTRLRHPNVLQLIEVGQHEGTYFRALEWVDGRSLAQLLERGGPIAAPIACFLASQVLTGLHYAHGLADDQGRPLKIVNSHVTPRNILVSHEGHAKVTGFGETKILFDSETADGKFEYMSPEQARGNPLNVRSDVFSVGVVLYRMLCGVTPFSGAELEVLKATLEGRCTPVEQVNPMVPAPLGQVVARAMAKDPAARYGSALEMQQALEALYRGDTTFSSQMVQAWIAPLVASEPPPVEPIAHAAPPRKSLVETLDAAALLEPPSGSVPLPIVGVLAGLVLLGGITFLALRPEPERGPPRAAAPPAARPPRPGPPVLPKPAVMAPRDVAVFPASVTVRADRHRIRFEGLELPGGSFSGVPQLVERDASDSDSPLFAKTRSADPAHDGQISLVLQRPVVLQGATGFQLFDFHPFDAPLRGANRTLDVGDPPVWLTFADAAAQIDARSATWMTVENVPPGEKVRLTLKPLTPEAWKGRPRPASVLVVWKRAFGRLLPPPGGDWPDEVDRAVLVADRPLIIEHATALAITFADSLATAEKDSVLVEVFGTGEPASKPDPEAVARAARAHLERTASGPGAAQLLAEALTLFQSQRFTSAREKLERCLVVSPRDFECHKLLGAVLDKLGDAKKAARSYREYVRLAPVGEPDVAKVKALLEGRP